MAHPLHHRRAPAWAACALLLLSVLLAGCGRPGAAPTASAAAAPVVEAWSVSPAQIGPGGEVTIRWRVSNVEEVTIQPFGELAASGEMKDLPQQTLRYTLTATNALGTVQRSQEVVVGEVAAPSAEAAGTELPSDTPEPPTATPEPPTATAEPPTATPEPPTTTPTISIGPIITLPAVTLGPLPLVTPTPTATPGPTWQHPIKVSDKQVIYHLRLTEAGQIRARAVWSGTQSGLTLLINGPGQVGFYARRDGPSPLEVVYNVTEGDLAAGNEWRVTVLSFGGGIAGGTIQITYPSGASVSPFVDNFAIQPGTGSSVSVIVLKRLITASGGTISGRATWTGSPTGLSLIINGPGMLSAYARQDGPSPLSVEYAASADDLSHGDTWRVSLTSFTTANAQGEIELRYPYIVLRPLGPIIIPTVSP